jgi:hypothetical protein
MAATGDGNLWRAQVGQMMDGGELVLSGWVSLVAANGFAILAPVPVSAAELESSGADETAVEAATTKEEEVVAAPPSVGSIFSGVDASKLLADSSDEDEPVKQPEPEPEPQPEPEPEPEAEPELELRVPDVDSETPRPAVRARAASGARRKRRNSLENDEDGLAAMQAATANAAAAAEVAAAMFAAKAPAPEPSPAFAQQELEPETEPDAETIQAITERLERSADAKQAAIAKLMEMSTPPGSPAKPPSASLSFAADGVAVGESTALAVEGSARQRARAWLAKADEMGEAPAHLQIFDSPDRAQRSPGGIQQWVARSGGSSRAVVKAGGVQARVILRPAAADALGQSAAARQEYGAQFASEVAAYLGVDVSRIRVRCEEDGM